MLSHCTEKLQASIQRPLTVKLQEKIFLTEWLENHIANGRCGPDLMERWVAKINTLETKKRDYEQLLEHELSELNDQYQSYCFCQMNYLYGRINLGWLST